MVEAEDTQTIEDEILFQIMDALLLGCRDEDENVRVSCADCIGAIGAVDPGHLSWRELQSGRFARICYRVFEIVNCINCKRLLEL
jgi:hypothetical protein